MFARCVCGGPQRGPQLSIGRGRDGGQTQGRRAGEGRATMAAGAAANWLVSRPTQAGGCRAKRRAREVPEARDKCASDKVQGKAGWSV